MSGASTALSTAIPNILSGAIPVNPPSYDWAIPANVATLPSCKFHCLDISARSLYLEKTFD
jgi:hypothetical protein